MVAVISNKRVHTFPDQDRLLGLRTLDKSTEFVVPTPGLICAGARDRPPITGNVRRGALPIAQLGPAPGEAVLQAGVSELEADVSLQELIQLRSRLLARAIGKP
jgi:hypothetical protein